jgi:hypothetical protein
VRTRYYPGGYEPSAPADNKSEEWSLDAGTYTRWNPDGAVPLTRPLTAQETAEMQALADGQTAAGHISDIAALLGQAIADNDTYLALTAPVADDTTAQVRRLTRQVTAIARYLGTVVPRPNPADYLSTVTDVTTP